MKFQWGVTTTQAYLLLDAHYFNNDLTLVDWLRQYAQTEEEREEVFIRGFLEKMIFSGRSPEAIQCAFWRRKSTLYAF